MYLPNLETNSTAYPGVCRAVWPQSKLLFDDETPANAMAVSVAPKKPRTGVHWQDKPGGARTTWNCLGNAQFVTWNGQSFHFRLPAARGAMLLVQVFHVHIDWVDPSPAAPQSDGGSDADDANEQPKEAKAAPGQRSKNVSIRPTAWCCAPLFTENMGPPQSFSVRTSAFRLPLLKICSHDIFTRFAQAQAESERPLFEAVRRYLTNGDMELYEEEHGPSLSVRTVDWLAKSCPPPASYHNLATEYLSGEHQQTLYRSVEFPKKPGTCKFAKTAFLPLAKPFPRVSAEYDQLVHNLKTPFKKLDDPAVVFVPLEEKKEQGNAAKGKKKKDREKKSTNSDSDSDTASDSSDDESTDSEQSKKRKKPTAAAKKPDAKSKATIGKPADKKPAAKSKAAGKDARSQTSSKKPIAAKEAPKEDPKSSGNHKAAKNIDDDDENENDDLDDGDDSESGSDDDDNDDDDDDDDDVGSNDRSTKQTL
jgi:hypothetical protein